MLIKFRAHEKNAKMNSKVFPLLFSCRGKLRQRGDVILVLNYSTKKERKGEVEERKGRENS